MAQLAIKGHPTRGKEVIEILEMLGGNNIYGHEGHNPLAMYWVIKSHNNRIGCSTERKDGRIFTLEEFLSEFPYKVGDKVQRKGATSCGSVFNIEKMYWDGEEVVYVIGNEDLVQCSLAAYRLQPFKEETMDEQKAIPPYMDYDVRTNKEETMEVNKYRLDNSDGDKLATEVTCDDFKITVPDNYLIGKVTKVDNGMLVEYVKKKPQYPKTYEECCEIMGIKYPVVGGKPDGIGASTYRIAEIRPLIYLLICRDAYWKIAGDWKFDFDKPCYYLCNEYGSVQKFEGTIDCNAILTFPTKEMRDAFYENFMDLVEEAKGLL